MTTLSPLDFFLVVQTESTVFTGIVSATPAAPYTQISYSGGITGSFGAPLAGQTVFFETTSGGRERGTARLKTWSGGASGTIEIGESDDTGPLIQSGDLIRIINQFRLWPKYPRFIQAGTNVTIFEDYDEAYSNQTNQWRPKAVAGPVGFAFLEGGTAQIKFVGDRSQAMAGGASIASRLWTFRNGSPATSTTQGTEASPVTATYTSPGWHLVTHQVTDSNGNTDIQHTYAVVDNPDNPSVVFTNYDIVSDSYDFQTGGGEMGFTVKGAANTTNFPKEGMVLLVARGDITTPTASWPFRTNVLFSGWILSNTVRQNPETGDVSFRAATIDAIMRNLTMFPVSLSDKTTPTNWTHAKRLDVDRAAYFLYKYRSTLGLMTPIIFSGYSPLIRRQDFGPTDLYSQVQNELMGSILGKVASTHQGVLYHVIDYNVQTTAERATATTRKTLHKGVWVNDVTIDERHDYSQPVNQVKMSGVYYPGGETDDLCPLFSEAPGDAPKVYGKEMNFDRLILASQSELNTRCGYKLAQLTQRYPVYRMQFINDGSFGIVPQDIFPASIEAADNDRSLTFSGNLIPRRMSRSFDHSRGFFMSNVEFEPVTTGPPGVTVDMPCGPPEQKLPTNTVPPVPASSLPGSSALFAATTGTSFYYQPGLTQPWQHRITGLVNPDQLGLLDMIPDPWSAFKQGYNPDNTIVWGSGRGFLVRSKDSGKNWEDRSSYLEPAPAWGGETNTVANTDIMRLSADIFSEDRLYVLAAWQYTGSYHGAVAKSNDGFEFTWYNITGSSQVRPLGMSLDKYNGNTLFITTWESDPTGTLHLRRYNAADMSLTARYSLGIVGPFDANSYYATPFNRLGQNCEVYIYGRMSAPQGFAGTVQVLKNTNCGATGSYSVIENTWDTSICGSFGADEQGYLYAVRNG